MHIQPFQPSAQGLSIDHNVTQAHSPRIRREESTHHGSVVTHKTPLTSTWFPGHILCNKHGQFVKKGYFKETGCPSVERTCAFETITVI